MRDGFHQSWGRISCPSWDMSPPLSTKTKHHTATFPRKNPWTWPWWNMFFNPTMMKHVLKSWNLMNMSKKQRQPTEFEHQKIPDVPKKKWEKFGYRAWEVGPPGVEGEVRLGGIQRHLPILRVRPCAEWGWLGLAGDLDRNSPWKSRGNQWKSMEKNGVWKREKDEKTSKKWWCQWKIQHNLERLL